MDVKQQARRAGLLYLLVALVAPISLVVIPPLLLVSGDPEATSARIVSSEWLIRLSVASELLYQFLQVLLAIALFRLFRQVNEALAMQLVVFGALLPVPIVFVNVLNDLAAVYFASGTIPPGIDSTASKGLAYFFLYLHEQGIVVAQFFWGVWLFPFGLLILRSNFIPPALGYLLFVAGAAYLLESAVNLLLPGEAELVKTATGLLTLCEVPIVFWLLIWGARLRSPEPGLDNRAKL